MRIVKILGIAVLSLLALLVLAAGGLFVYLQNADLAPWAVSAIRDNTGLDIKTEGPMTLKLLPHPELHAAKVTVPAYRGEQPLLTFDNADIVLSWGQGWAFWEGITLTELTLTNPTAHLVRPVQGPANWEADATGSPPTQPTDEEKAAAKNLKRIDKFPIASFGVIHMSNLNLTFVDETANRTIRAENVNLKADGTNLADASMALDGRINGQPLNGNATFNFTDLQRVPLTTNLTAASLKLALNGEVRTQDTYAGAVNVQSPNLKAALDALMGNAPPQIPAEAFSITGDVVAGGENLALKNFNASLGNLLKATGNIDVVMGATPSAEGSFMAQGSNLRQLAALATGAPSTLPAQPFKISTKLAGKNEIRLTGLNAELADLLAMDGDITVVPATGNGLPRVDGRLHARAGNTRQLAQAFGVNATLPTQSLDASMGISGRDTYDISNLTIQIGNLATLTGDVKVTPQPTLKMAGNIAIQGNNIAAAATAFGVSGNLPRSAYAVNVTLAGEKRIELSNVNVKLPQLLEATGNLSLLPAAPYDMQGNLAISRLNLDALGYCAKQSNSGTTAETASTQAPPASETPWSDERLPLDALNAATFNLTAAIQGITCAAFPLQSLDAVAINTATTLNVSRLDANLQNGGSVKTTLKLTHTGKPTMKTTMNLTNVAVHELVRTMADKGMQLPVNGTVNLSAQGASTRALVQTLNGNIAMNANSGRIPYSNMLGNISNIAGLLQGKLPTQNSDALRRMVANFSVTNGVMNTEEVNLTTDGLTLNGTGTVNLPAWSINYTLTPEAVVGDKVSIPINIQGSLGAPNIGPDKEFISKLTGRLATEGLKGLLGVDKGDAKGIGGAVGDLLGGQGLQGEGTQNLLKNLLPQPKAASPTPEPTPEANPAEGTTEPTPPPAPPTPEDAVKGLLNNFLNQ